MSSRQKVQTVKRYLTSKKIGRIKINLESVLVHSGAFNPKEDDSSIQDIWLALDGNSTVDDYYKSAPHRVKSTNYSDAYQTHFKPRQPLDLCELDPGLSMSDLLNQINADNSIGMTLYITPDAWHREILPEVCRDWGVDGLYQEFSPDKHEIMVVDFISKLNVIDSNRIQ